MRYRASQSSHASRKMPRSPRLAHKAPVMQAICRLTITSPDKKNVWNKKKLSPREAGPLGFSCKILLNTALLLRNNCVKYFCNKMPSLIVVKIGLIRYRLNRNQLESFENVQNVPHFVHKFWIGVYRPEA